MKGSISVLIFVCLMILGMLGAPALGGTVTFSSGDGGESASLVDSFSVDRSTYMLEQVALDKGSISTDRKAGGSGNNSFEQSLSGNDYSLHNDIQSDGALSISTSSHASGQSASIGQDVAGSGSLSLNLRGEEEGAEAGQEASVACGTLTSAQSLSVGGVAFAYQSTDMEGLGGKVVSGALGQENVMLAEGGFSGQGSMQANLLSAASERAFSSGSAAIDNVLILDDDSFKAVSLEGGSQIMGASGMRLVEDGKGIGSFDMTVMNLDLAEEKSAAQTSQTAAATSGGSYSSYALTGYRLNTRDPKVQLYLNPTGAPSGVTTAASQSAISAAANAWDDAVAQNIFADGSTVIVDYNKVVDNPFPAAGQEKSDGYCVSGWKHFGNSYLGLNRWWSNGQKVDGYYSITESDIWYNTDYQWTTDLATAQSTGKIDLQ
ncbi:MAG: hypothetical protein JW999_07890, partial [Methanotrichaceae archaeon]|nr:hypothetical protein [Methanotrichaceae archaeon]